MTKERAIEIINSKNLDPKVKRAFLFSVALGAVKNKTEEQLNAELALHEN